MRSRSPVPVLRFDTGDVGGAAAYETWRGSSWPGFGSAFQISGDVTGFHYRGELVPTPRLTLSSFSIGGLTWRRPAGLARRDGHDSILVQLTLRGGNSAGEAGGVPYRSVAGSLDLVDFSREIVQTTLDTRAVCLLLSRDLFTTEQAERVAGPGWAHAGGPLLADFMLSLLQRLPGASPESAAKAERAAAVVLLACQTREADALAEARPMLETAAVGAARRFVQARLADPRLSPEVIAAAVGVSRATLYRALASQGGVERFVLRERLATARDAVLNSSDRRSLTAIAQACGFADAAHFSRTFRERYGLRPSDLRPIL